MRILRDEWSLPEALRQRVGARAGRQRLMLHEGHALLLLHQVPAEDDRDRHAVAFWRDPQGAWRCWPGKDGVATLRALIDAYAARVDALDDRSDAAKSASDYFAVLRAARPIQRSARNMHAALQLLRDALPHDTDVLAARDRAYEVERAADLLVDDAQSGMQFTVAQRGEEQAQTSERIARESHRLNLLAAVCLPVTALGAVLSVNIPTGLEALPEPLTYWVIVAGAFTIGLVLRSRVQRAAA